MSDKTPVRFTDLFRYYKGLPHQMAAIQELGELIPASLLHKSNNWYRTWTQDGKQPDPDWMAPALSIIKRFEGCKLTAYRCPAGVWTIGWGSTRLMDGPVQEGDQISQAEADELLQWDVECTARDVFRIFPEVKQWSGNRVAALISFVYNVGSGAAEGSTLRKRLAAGEDPNTVVAEELPRWNKANGEVLTGLTRRRAAEVELFVGKQLQQPELQEPVPPPLQRNPMNTPYFSQLDNASGVGYRECFSSSCAMVAAFYGKVKTDDEYNVIRARYGDTTSSEAQLRALRSLGLTANFHTDGNPEKLKELLHRGRPVPVGWLHQGPVSAPSGGGHWSVVIGIDDDCWVVNDPNGEADLVHGGYTPDTNGHGERYSLKNFNRRWEVDGPGTGWYLEIRD